jgi:hypothetical protein
MRNLLLATALGLSFAAPAQAIQLVNNLQVANGSDLSGFAPGVNGNRLGGFGSDLIFDAASGTYFGMTDRGPGGGLLNYAPRIQQFSLAHDPLSGAVSGFNLVNTIVFNLKAGQSINGFTVATDSYFNGLNSTGLYNDVSKLGISLDSEGLVRMNNGHFLVSDEYGPSVYEFDELGTFVRNFQVPANLVPIGASGADYVNGRPTITTGRQDNRGFEGLTLSPDGTKAYAILQDPLVDEGNMNDGRRSRNVRVVEYDVATGESTGQYVYRLENRDDINDRIPGTAEDFSATNQGRSIGASAIITLPDGRMLVLERDNRGLGVDPTTMLPVGSKRVFMIDLDGATDVSGISLAGANGLPGGVNAFDKSLFLDIQAALEAAGFIVPEKIEGLAFGPWLADGGLSLLVITDNDFSVTQTGSGEQFDVCTSADGKTSVTVTLDAACPTGLSSIPTNIYAFKLSASEAKALGFQAPVPEPATWAMMIGGFALVGSTMRRRKTSVQFA